MSIDQRLAELGITLPQPAAPVASYVPAVERDGLLHISGQISFAEDGNLIKGRLGEDMDVEAGIAAARRCGVMLLAQMKAALGSLDRVEKVVKLGVFVNSARHVHRPAQGGERRVRADAGRVRRSWPPCAERGWSHGPAAWRRGRSGCDRRRRTLTRSILGPRGSLTGACTMGRAFRRTASSLSPLRSNSARASSATCGLTADDQIIVFHDRETWRMCSSHLIVGNSTHAELSRLRVGDGPIPTLESLLSLVDGQVPLLLEVKVDKDIWRWIPALKRALGDYRGRHGVMSFDPRVARLLKTNVPRVRRGLVIKDSLSPVRRSMALALADPHFIAVDRTALGKSWVARERERRPVYSWTIKGPQQRTQAQVHADALIWEADGRP